MTNYNKEIGFSGLKAWGGQIQEEFLRELQGQNGYKRYNEMRMNCPVAGALLMAIEQAVRSVRWYFASDEGEDDQRLLFLNDCWDDLDWNAHISDALTMMPFGFALFEIVYRRDGSKLVWDKFAVRGQDTVDTWNISTNGLIEGFNQRVPPTYAVVALPSDKLIHYRLRVEKNNPEGRSIFRTAWTSYYYWKNISQIEGISLERGGAGFPVVTMPAGATTDETDSSSDAYKAAKIVRNVRLDEQAGIVLPESWLFSFISPSGGDITATFDKVITRYESRILMSALAQFLMLGQSSVGTQALSSDQTDFFTMSANSVADTIAQTFTNQAVRKLLKLNGMDDIGIRLEHSPAGDVDLNKIGTFLQQAGDRLTWMPSDEMWLRAIAHMPEVEEETLQDERDQKAAVGQAIMARMKQKAGETPEDKPEDQTKGEQPEEFAASRFVDRGVWEMRLQRLIKRYFERQKMELIKAAQEMKR
jgi:hypothetical protein